MTSERIKMIATVLGIIVTLGSVGVLIHDYFAKKEELEYLRCESGKNIQRLTGQVGVLLARENREQVNEDIVKAEAAVPKDVIKIRNLEDRKKEIEKDFDDAKGQFRRAAKIVCK